MAHICPRQQREHDQREGAQREPAPGHLGVQVESCRDAFPYIARVGGVFVLVCARRGDAFWILSLQQGAYPCAHRGQVVGVQVLGGAAVGIDER